MQPYLRTAITRVCHTLALATVRMTAAHMVGFTFTHRWEHAVIKYFSKNSKYDFLTDYAFHCNLKGGILAQPVQPVSGGRTTCGPRRCPRRLEPSVLLAFTPAWGRQLPQSPWGVGDTPVPTSLPDLGLVILPSLIFRGLTPPQLQQTSPRPLCRFHVGAEQSLPGSQGPLPTAWFIARCFLLPMA